MVLELKNTFCTEKSETKKAVANVRNDNKLAKQLAYKKYFEYFLYIIDDIASSITKIWSELPTELSTVAHPHHFEA